MSVTLNEQQALEHDESYVVEVTADEWRDAISHALRTLGLTWDELQEQARRREFSSRDARALWAAVGLRGGQR